MTYYVSNQDTRVVIDDNAKKLGEGIEGTVYLYEGLAIKILKKTSWMDEQKIEYLKDLEPPKLLVFPKEAVYTEDGHFCGYVMEYIPKLSIAYNTILCADFINNLEALLKDMEYLSQHFVAVNDMALRNVIVNNCSGDIQLYVVDTDRYLTKFCPRCNLFASEEFLKHNLNCLNRLMGQILLQIVELEMPMSQSRDFRISSRNYIKQLVEAGLLLTKLGNSLSKFTTFHEFFEADQDFVRLRK